MQAPDYDGSSLLMAENGAIPAEPHAIDNPSGLSGEGADAAADAGPEQDAPAAEGAAPADAPASSDGGGASVEPAAADVPAPDISGAQPVVPDASSLDGAAAAASPGADVSALPSFDIFSTDFLIPALFALFTVLFWFFGLRQSRLQTRRWVLMFLALNSLTLTVCLAADYNMAGRVPDWALKLSPLLWAVLYLIVGGVGKRPLVWGSALVTPGLWFFAQRLDSAYFGLSRFTMQLPQDPAWFLLIGVALFALMHVARIQKFWDDMEQPELTASFCYGMAGFWLLSLGEASALAMFGLPVYAWMIVLLGLAAVGLWVARLLGDLVLAVCCGLGIIGVLYSYGMYVFGPSAAA
jgi:hypothetical protein